MLKVTISHDPDVESPASGDCQWKLISFSRRHASFQDPAKLGYCKPGSPKITDRKLKAKLDNGLAHFLSYFEHGQCLWFRRDGVVPAGVEFQWDGVRQAGLLIWDHPADEIGAKTFEDRAKDADGFLETYTQWCNGETYHYAVESEDGEHIDSCGGFIGLEHLAEALSDSIGGRPFEINKGFEAVCDLIKEKAFA